MTEMATFAAMTFGLKKKKKRKDVRKLKAFSSNKYNMSTIIVHVC